MYPEPALNCTTLNKDFQHRAKVDFPVLGPQSTQIGTRSLRPKYIYLDTWTLREDEKGLKLSRDAYHKGIGLLLYRIGMHTIRVRKGSYS